jgi:hypothetical protein
MDQATPATPPLCYSMKGLAAATSFSRSELYNEVKKGRLKITKHGTRTVVLASDAHAWLQLLKSEQPK